MNYQSITSLKDGEKVDSIYLIKDLETGKTSTGKAFVKFFLQDATGNIPAMVWNLSLTQKPAQIRGGFIHLMGSVKGFNGNLNITTDASCVRHVGTPSNLQDYVPIINDNILDIFIVEIKETIQGVEDRYLRTILNYIFNQDKEFEFPNFKRIKNSPHETKLLRGGLIYYLYYGLKTAIAVINAHSDADKKIDRDYVIAAWLLHELARPKAFRLNSYLYLSSEELGYIDIDIESYSQAQQLYLAVESMLKEEIPDEIKLKLNHAILACQGKISPITTEGKLLKYIKEIENDS